jgi:type II secretory pathway pseudopilin PulG
MQLVLHRRKDEHAASAGFTIVELAVVMAMTAILTALLLPALSSAKEKSRRALCKNNGRQVYLVCDMYASDSGDFLPNPVDNVGNYHSIRLSDQTYTNLVGGYAEGVSNIFYCPNLVFNAGPNGVGAHDSYGYIIGYSYLAANVTGTLAKGAEETVLPMKLTTSAATNKLLADANYWAFAANTSSTTLKMAPHTASGASMAPASSATITNSASLGAMGGNVTLFDGSVTWRPISSMQTYSASSLGDATGNW